MLILLISWSFLFFLCLLISQIIKSRYEDIFTRFLLGLTVLSVYLHLWVLFLPARFALLPLILFVNAYLIEVDKRKKFTADIKRFVTKITISGWFLLFALLFITSLPPFINDDGAYYQQTIKWLSEFGYVQGLANLKIHFGLTSSWHLISSAFFFEGLPFSRYYNFNGLLLFILCVSLLKKFPGKQIFTIASVIILGSLFINAPSPDLVIFIGAFWILLNLHQIKPTDLAMIIGFLITVKITAGGIVLFLIPRLNEKSNVVKSLAVLTLFGVILITRNLITSGYPFFPLDFLAGFGTLPETIIENFRVSVLHEIFDKFQLEVIASYDVVNNYYERFIALFQLRSYKVLMNVLILASFILTPLVLIVTRKKEYYMLALLIIINGLLWFVLAPYYRFAIGFLLFMIYLLHTSIPVVMVKLKYQNMAVIISAALIVFLNVNLKEVLFTINCVENKEFSLANIIYPVAYPKVEYEKVGDFYVTNCSYCYDAPLPCFSEPVMKAYTIDAGYKPILINPEDPGKGFLMTKN